MFFDGIILAILVWLILHKRRKNTVFIINNYAPEKPVFFERELTESEIQKTEQIVFETLLNYPDAECGNAFPDIKYKALGVLLSSGKITREYYTAEVDKILKYL